MDDLQAEVTSAVTDLINSAMEEAASQLDIVGDNEREIEALHVQRAIENLAEAETNARQAILQLMWRMESEQLFAELGHPTLEQWALSNPRLLERWSKITIKRYANAISRVLPALVREPVVDESTGEIITPEALLEQGTISGLTDMAYTFSQTENPEDHKAIILSIWGRDNEEDRDALQRQIRGKQNPVGTITVYTDYTEGFVDFRGRATVDQWQTMMALSGSLIDERGVEPQIVAVS